MSLRPDRSFRLAPASVADYRELARRRLPRQLFDYIDGGAYEESTLAANVSDLGALRLRQRVLRDVSDVDLGTELFGRRLSMPVVLAPVGLAGMFSPRAEVAAARAAEAAGVPFCESTVSIAGIEEVERATADPLWFQLYIMRDRDYAADLLARATAARCRTLVLTVDLAVVGERYRDTRNGMTGPATRLSAAVRALDFATHPRWVRDVAVGGKPHTFGNLEKAVPDADSPEAFRAWVDSQFDPSVTWDDLEWVRANWSGEIVLKGILDVDDARRAADAGVAGLIVSNHGGRQLDDTPSTASVLPQIARAVGDELVVLADGGVRSGLDVVKMIALGARAVLIGRPWAYAVAAGGEPAVAHLLEVIRGGMEVAMGLCGVTDVDSIDHHALVEAP